MAYNGGGGYVAANSPNPWDWETWKLETNDGKPLADGSIVALKCYKNLYLSSDGSWTSATANRFGKAGWELFQVSREAGAGRVRSGERIALKGWQGAFLGANFNSSDGRMGCWFSFGGYGGWETLTVVVK